MTRLQLTAALAALLGAAAAHAQPTSAPTKHAGHVHETMAAGPAQEGSIYPLGTTLETHTGAKVALDLYQGHPVLISMFFAHCTSACPLLIRDLKAIDAALEPWARARVRVLLVTFDVARDDPAALAELAKKHGVDVSRWTFARAKDDEATRELAGALGIKYRRLNNGDYNHASVITALGPHGRPLGRIEGLGQDATALRATLAAAAKAPVKATPKAH